jgi:hypothetical protein
VLAVASALVGGDYESVLRLTPGRLALDDIVDGMTQTDEVFLPPKDEHLDCGLQLYDGPGAELFLPFMTAEGPAELELQLQVAEDGELVLWNILVP